MNTFGSLEKIENGHSKMYFVEGTLYVPGEVIAFVSRSEETGDCYHLVDLMFVEQTGCWLLFSKLKKTKNDTEIVTVIPVTAENAKEWLNANGRAEVAAEHFALARIA